MRKFVVSAAGSLVATAALLGAVAAPAGAEEVSVSVHYTDLNLLSEAGRAQLEARIDAAVKQVCARPETSRDLKAMEAWEACRTDATAKAYAQLDRVTAVAVR